MNPLDTSIPLPPTMLVSTTPMYMALLEDRRAPYHGSFVFDALRHALVVDYKLRQLRDSVRYAASMVADTMVDSNWRPTGFVDPKPSFWRKLLWKISPRIRRREDVPA